jgi:hypothetical protein
MFRQSHCHCLGAFIFARITPARQASQESEADMLRLALWSLLLAVVLCGIGWTTNALALFEVFRAAGAFFLIAAVVLFVVNYARTPEPPEK